MSLLLVILGAAVGAPLRYLTDQAVQARLHAFFPWGTFTVNVVGSLILGLLTGATVAGAAPHSVQVLVGVGFCGALTTYSTFGHETLRLVANGAIASAVANVAASVAAALGAAIAGAVLGQAIWS